MNLPRTLPVVRFGAALSDGAVRAALRQAADAELHTMLAAISTRIGPVLDFHGRAPLDALVLDVSLLDTSVDLATLQRQTPDTKLILVGEAADARRISRSSDVTAVVDHRLDPELVARHVLSHVASGAASRPATTRRTKPQEPTPPAARTSPETRTQATRSTPSVRPAIIVLACSTGGPKALSTVLPALPADFPVPILIVQHMPPNFTKQLADRLDANSALSVREVTEPVDAKPGDVWIAPGGRHIVLASRLGRIELNDGPPENSCRPSADVLFRSAAEYYGQNALGVVLTGMGDDGTKGARALTERGASIVIQDKASSVVWGMPGSIARAGLAGLSVPLDTIASTLVRLSGRPLGQNRTPQSMHSR